MNGISPYQTAHLNVMDRTASGAAAKDDKAALKKAATEFEALFMNQLLKVMRETVSKSSLFHGGSGEEVYNSLFDTELSNMMAKGGGIGLGKVLLDQLDINGKSAVPGQKQAEASSGIPLKSPAKAYEVKKHE
jgi:Rod binding domain-containing protein